MNYATLNSAGTYQCLNYKGGLSKSKRRELHGLNDKLLSVYGVVCTYVQNFIQTSIRMRESTRIHNKYTKYARVWLAH